MTERGVVIGGLAAFVALCAVAVWLHAQAQVQIQHGAAPPQAATPTAAPTVEAAPSPSGSPAIELAKPELSVPASSPTPTPKPALSASPKAAQSAPVATTTTAVLARPTPTSSPTPTPTPRQSSTPTASPAAAVASPSSAKKVEQDIAKQLTRKVIEFESVSDKLTDNGKAVLSSLVPLFAQDPTSRFEIGGHTDSWGEKEFNQALSERRARTVRAYLVSKGVDGARLTARGYGDSKPIANNKTSSGSRKNRRIEFTAQ